MKPSKTRARVGAGGGGQKPISFNENLSMMKALAEVALAADSALYRGSPDVTPERLRLATEEVPLLIAKNVAFFVDHLRPNTLPDGTPYFEWYTPTVDSACSSEIEDLSHGGIEIGCLAVILDDQIRLNALLARAGRSERVPLSPSLFERFANTFLRKIWHNDNMLNAKVDGTGDGRKLELGMRGVDPTGPVRSVGVDTFSRYQLFQTRPTCARTTTLRCFVTDSSTL